MSYVVSRAVQTTEERLLCSTPGCSGELANNGVILASNPPAYPHTCPACGRVENFEVRYPRLVHRAVPR